MPEAGTALTVEKAVDVLFELHARPEAGGVSELGRALGLPKSSVHRLLSALGRRGLVEKDERGRYRPGLALVALGLGALEREPVVAAARPILEREAEALGETLFLAAARAGRISVLDKAEGAGFLRAAPRVGSEVPADTTAVGKLYRAFAPDEVDAPRADPPADAWAENRDEWVPGLTALAAPIWLHGRMIAALALAGPTARITESQIRSLGPRVVAAAERVGSLLQGGSQ